MAPKAPKKPAKAAPKKATKKAQEKPAKAAPMKEKKKPASAASAAPRAGYGRVQHVGRISHITTIELAALRDEWREDRAWNKKMQCGLQALGRGWRRSSGWVSRIK